MAMRAAAMDLMAKGVGDTGLLSVPPSSQPKRSLSFRERGFSFIPTRPAHLDLLACVYGRWVPPFEELEGKTLIDHRFMPLGVVVVHHEVGGKKWLLAHFREWPKIYPKDILRGMHEVADDVGPGHRDVARKCR